MSNAAADLPQTITKMKGDLKTLAKERDQLNKKLLDYEAAALITEGKKLEDIHLVKKIFKDRTPKEIKLLANKIVEASADTVILFGTKNEKNAQLLFQCSAELTLDMGRLMASACAVIKGRGGGRPQQAQGGGPQVEKLGEALQSVEDRLLEMIRSQ